MKIPENVLQKYKITGEDEKQFLYIFNEPVGRVVEVGAHDEPVANILSECGFSVTGFDLREYNPNQDIKDSGEKPLCNYAYVRGDFCDLEPEILNGFLGTYDIAISLSAIEHFGLGTYGEGGSIQPYYDVIACRQVWQLLKPGGVFYLSVPFGGRHIDNYPHWRIYNQETVVSRMVQDFEIDYGQIFVAAPMQLGNRWVKEGDVLTVEEVHSYTGDVPHLSILLKLRKQPRKRMAPDGR